MAHACVHSCTRWAGGQLLSRWGPSAARACACAHAVAKGCNASSDHRMPASGLHAFMHAHAAPHVRPRVGVIQPGPYKDHWGITQCVAAAGVSAAGPPPLHMSIPLNARVYSGTYCCLLPFVMVHSAFPLTPNVGCYRARGETHSPRLCLLYINIKQGCAALGPASCRKAVRTAAPLLQLATAYTSRLAPACGAASSRGQAFRVQ